MEALIAAAGIALEIRVGRNDGCGLLSSSPIPILQQCLREQHGCEATHLWTTYVEELHPDGVKWRLDVETFQLENAENGRCYGWMDPADGTPVTVCERGSVIGPASAVRSSFVPAASEA